MNDLKQASSSPKGLHHAALLIIWVLTGTAQYGDMIFMQQEKIHLKQNHLEFSVCACLLQAHRHHMVSTKNVDIKNSFTKQYNCKYFNNYFEDTG